MLRRIFSILPVFILTAALLLNNSSNAAELQARPDLKKIDGYIVRMMKECRIPGFSLASVKDGKVVYTQGYGVADPSGRKVTPETPFQIASVSKTFTALAVMQLAEAGKVSLDEPICTYMPWFELADKKASQTITVRELRKKLKRTEWRSDTGRFSGSLRSRACRTGLISHLPPAS